MLVNHPRRTPLLVAAVAIAAAAPVVAPTMASGATAHAASGATVVLKNYAFKAKTVHIGKGGTVHWVWRDGSVPHNVTFKGFHSKTITKGKYSHRFTKKGTFRYRCTIHPGMDGKVVVG